MKKDIRILIYSLVVFGAFLMLTNSCKKDDDNTNPSSSGTVKDIDGNVYHTVTIGTQIWMVENLRTSKYRDGSPILKITDNKWEKLTIGAFCNFNNDPTIDSKYGKLYNWYAVNNDINIAPDGWRVASDADWKVLEDFVTKNSDNVAKSLSANTDWNSDGFIGSDLTKNNSSGFNALPGAYRVSDGTFGFIGRSGCWWTSTEKDIDNASTRILNYDSDKLIIGSYRKNRGFSIRCVKN